MTQYELWVELLRAKGLRPEKRRGYWMAHCPAHNDPKKSLSVSEGRDGRVLAYCHAGCPFEAIRDALDVSNAPRSAFSGRSRASKPDPPSTPQPLPSGRNTTIYRYTDANGDDVLAVVRRDMASGKRISQWRPADGGWIAKGVPGNVKLPLYRLPALLAVPPDQGVVVVEGEKCVHACLDLWPEQPVTTWAGGTKAWQRSDWTPLANRTITLVADGDAWGHAVMGEIAARLAALGCKVWMVLPPADGSDIADWIEADPTGRNAGEMIRRHRMRWLPRAVETDAEDGEAAEAAVVAEAEGIVADLATEPLRTNQHYRLLGLHGDLIAVRIAAGRLMYRSRESLMNPSTLLALASDEKFWLSLTDGNPLTVVQSRMLGSAIVRQADRMGQVDLHRITGRGAVRTPEGEVLFHLGDRLWRGDGEMSLEDGMTEGGPVFEADSRLPLGAAATDDEMRAIGESVMQYRWASPVDGRRLMGWIVAAIIGGALEWRPHILMNARAGSGKSWLLDHVVEPLMGPLCHRIADATPAALSRQTASSSLPVVWDEFEPDDPGVTELFKQLRIASGAAGMRLRADNTSGGVFVQRARYCALLAGAAAPKLSRADASRMTLVRLGDEVADWPSVRNAIKGAMGAAAAARSRIVQRSAGLVAETSRVAAEFQDDGLDSREALATAALTVGWQAWGVDNATVWAGTDAGSRDDAEGCLLDMLALKWRGEGKDRSLLGLIRSRDTALEYAAADLYGVRRGEDGSLLVAADHRGLASALSRTAWGSTDLAKLLRQLPGAHLTNHPRRFGNLRSRAMQISASTLAVLGVDLDSELDPEGDEPMPDPEMDF